MGVSGQYRQAQLVMPLLQALEAAPEGLSAASAVEAVAERIGLPVEARDAVGALPGGAPVALFARDLRWARQRAKLAGQVDGETRNLWRLTPAGRKDLRLARPGVVITVFETANGAALWAEAESAFGAIEDGSVNLWVTSPPYDIERAKDYGGRRGDEYLEWLSAMCAEMKRTLADDGSLVLNLGDAWEKGRPVQSLYQERLLVRLVDEVGLHCAQKLAWHNPAKLPGPAQWVTIEKCRVTPATENLYWLSKTPRPKADNRRVLRAYSESMLQKLAAGGEKARRRPSGHVLGTGSFSADRGGSTPHSLLTAANTSSNDVYQRACRERGLPVHPARFPEAVPEFFVKFLSEEGDLVGDCFAGSCTTGAVAERLGRRWVAVEQSLSYLQGAVHRFPGAEVRL